MERVEEYWEKMLDMGVLIKGRGPTNRYAGLVGRLISDKPYNVFSLIDNVVKGFKTKVQGSVTAREVEKNLILFSFEATMDRETIIKYQPWHFHEDLFAIATVVGDTKPSSDLIKKVALWTRIYDLPLDDHNEETLMAIANELGELIRYEVPDSLNLNTYIKFKIAVDLENPLKKVFKMTLNGNILTLSIRYEWIPNYCFGCGWLGHHLQRCATYD